MRLAQRLSLSPRAASAARVALRAIEAALVVRSVALLGVAVVIEILGSKRCAQCGLLLDVALVRADRRCVGCHRAERGAS